MRTVPCARDSESIVPRPRDRSVSPSWYPLPKPMGPDQRQDISSPALYAGVRLLDCHADLMTDPAEVIAILWWPAFGDEDLGNPPGSISRAIAGGRLPEDRAVAQSFERCYDAFGGWLAQTGHAGLQGFRAIRDIARDGTGSAERGAFLD